jgi:hypothetical protein
MLDPYPYFLCVRLILQKVFGNDVFMAVYLATVHSQADRVQSSSSKLRRSNEEPSREGEKGGCVNKYSSSLSKQPSTVVTRQEDLHRKSSHDSRIRVYIWPRSTM